MSRLAIKIITDTSGFKKMFNNNLELWAQGTQKAFTGAGLAIMRDIGERFEGEGMPPQRWQPLSPATILRRRTGKGKKKTGRPKILQDTGTLKRSFMFGGPDNVFDVSPLHVTVGSKLNYAGIHQFGWKEKNIPARPMVRKPEEVPQLKEEIEEIFSAVMLRYIAK